MPWSKSLKGEDAYWEMEQWPFVPETIEVTTPIWCCWNSLWWMAQKWASQGSWELQWKWFRTEYDEESDRRSDFSWLTWKATFIGSSVQMLRSEADLQLIWILKRAQDLCLCMSPLCVKVWVAQSCLALCNPVGCCPPGSSVHGILRQEYWSG